MVWFLGAGALIVAVDRLATPPSPPVEAPAAEAVSAQPEPIRVDEAVLTDVRHRLTDALGRAPTDAEFDAAVERWINDALLIREARRLGLGQRDPVVRDRLAGRMADLHRDRAVPERPDDAALQALYAAHRGDYRLPPRLTIRQLFIAAPAADGAAYGAARARAEALLATLGDGAPPASPDPPPGGPTLRGRRPARLAEVYGAAFVEGLTEAPLQTWLIRPSPGGWHVLRIESRRAGRQLSFAEARDRLAARWMREQAEAAAARAVADLRARTPIEGWPRAR